VILYIELINVYPKYNRAIRMLYNLHYQTHRYILYYLVSSPPLNVQLCIRFLKMFTKMSNSDNEIVNFLARYLKCDHRSIICKNLLLSEKAKEFSISHEELSTAAVVKELLECQHSNYYIPLFSPTEIETLLLDICIK
jgi:hypothetical protein